MAEYKVDPKGLAEKFAALIKNRSLASLQNPSIPIDPLQESFNADLSRLYSLEFAQAQSEQFAIEQRREFEKAARRAIQGLKLNSIEKKGFKDWFNASLFKAAKDQRNLSGIFEILKKQFRLNKQKRRLANFERRLKRRKRWQEILKAIEREIKELNQEEAKAVQQYNDFVAQLRENSDKRAHIAVPVYLTFSETAGNVSDNVFDLQFDICETLGINPEELKTFTEDSKEEFKQALVGIGDSVTQGVLSFEEAQEKLLATVEGQFQAAHDEIKLKLNPEDKPKLAALKNWLSSAKDTALGWAQGQIPGLSLLNAVQSQQALLAQQDPNAASSDMDLKQKARQAAQAAKAQQTASLPLYAKTGTGQAALTPTASPSAPTLSPSASPENAEAGAPRKSRPGIDVPKPGDPPVPV